ncbi:MGMT family protein [Motilimonas cestriensis]|uniref:MGMT family protein n=1 Tax=Motilimonas cestriensis TaxID=2742685 RepID=UPI003DA34459
MSEQKYQQIYQVIQLIPEGSVAFYGQVADLAGLPKHARLVSKALKVAPSELNLPWHRVVSSQGKIAIAKNTPLYHEQKQRLLVEGVAFKGERILPAHYWQPDLFTLLTQLTH